jgi:hypothetical protein
MSISVDKPPDFSFDDIKNPHNYRIIKTSLESIVFRKHGVRLNMDPIHDAIRRTHRFTVLAYEFIRLYLLHTIKMKICLRLPKIDSLLLFLVVFRFLTIVKPNKAKTPNYSRSLKNSMMMSFLLFLVVKGK